MLISLVIAFSLSATLRTHPVFPSSLIEAANEAGLGALRELMRGNVESAVKRKTVCELLNNVVFSEERNISFNSPISDGELDEALDCLKTDKSKGADNISL
ncbi:hypothetical protein CEXT_631491 [Caerostris extrusa]|uniref:Uncharacterized protein n=1 Tax=Caerostris extrusa TaxID=172846 RepID=A0AAV4RWU2_CAEEX|nr:hypothetical protein CEXT_631491 [Caerostris extrusa]